MGTFLPTIQTLQLVCSNSPRRFTVRINLCHLNLYSNVKYESNNITTLSSWQCHAGILIFWWRRRVIRKRYLHRKRDRWPAAEWKQYGAVARRGVLGEGGWRQIIRRFLGTLEHMYWSIIISFRTLCHNVKAGFVLETTFALLSVFFFLSNQGPVSNTFRSMKDWHQFIDL